jgi:hypothetical protein
MLLLLLLLLLILLLLDTCNLDLYVSMVNMTNEHQRASLVAVCYESQPFWKSDRHVGAS